MAIEINDVSFEIEADTSGWVSSFTEYAKAIDQINWSYTKSSNTNFFSGAISDFGVWIEEASKSLKDFAPEFSSEDLLTDENRAERIRSAVGWFKSEDLGLLYKVLDDPQSFGITRISGGHYINEQLIGEDEVLAYDACIVGALAVAKAPKEATPEQIEELASEITDNGVGGSIALGLLDLIINKGYLDEFKAEIQRQMIER